MIVSDCCGASVSTGTMKEYPLGGSTWYESYKIDVCDKCEKPCETKEEDQ